MPPTLPLLEDLLQSHRGALGADAEGYTNHARRVATFCLALLPATGGGEALSPHALQQLTAEREDKVAIAAALHDIGIWTAGTFDYIAPSVAVANETLATLGRAEWTTEVATMIREHHKLLPVRSAPSPLVEAFRRADLVDVSRGVIRFGLPRSLIRSAVALWPSAGFHRRLVELSLRRLASHPLRPLPMVHW